MRLRQFVNLRNFRQQEMLRLDQLAEYLNMITV
jgi:hypothetical protein